MRQQRQEAGGSYHHDAAIGEKRRQDLGDGVHNDLEAFDAADNLDKTQHTQHQQHVQSEAALLLWMIRDNVPFLMLFLFGLTAYNNNPGNL